MANNNRTPLPLVPLDVLPKITTTCVYGNECYHRQYWTEITHETAPTHPYFRPCAMMQMFSLRLSSPLAHPINIYGTFSVRDCWEPGSHSAIMYLSTQEMIQPRFLRVASSFLCVALAVEYMYCSIYFLTLIFG